MALTDDEQAALRDIAAAISREDPRLVSSLRTLTPARTSPWVIFCALLVLTVVLLVTAAWLQNPAALVLAVSYLVLLPPGAWLVRRQGWM